MAVLIDFPVPGFLGKFWFFGQAALAILQHLIVVGRWPVRHVRAQHDGPKMDMEMVVLGESVGVGLNGKRPPETATVAVVIPTFNQARFLSDAITSVLAQTRQADEIIVVDDGSTDDPAAVVAQFPKVLLIRQENRGLSGARNTGLRNSTSSHVVFLDSDDRLMPKAIEAGLACIASRPDCAFVYGGFHLISESGRIIGPDYVDSIDGDAHLAFLRQGISTPSMVLFRRDCLLEADGFDETLRRVEDRDLYLRITQKYPIAGHKEIVTEYRRHGQNMSGNHVEQLKVLLQILDRYEARNPIDTQTRAALRDGRASKRKYFATEMVREAASQWRARRDVGMAMRYLVQSARWTPYFTLCALVAAFARHASKVLPRPVVRLIALVRGQPYPIPLGSVDFGDFRRLSPIGHAHFSRGMPIDRYYIEKFLAQNASDIHGCTLEIAADYYTVRFGGERVTRSEVLHAVPGNPAATLVGDLVTGKGIPGSAFDCMILTQTLPFIYDIKQSVIQIRNALRPGGVALITAAGISQMSRHDVGVHWRFTDASARRIFSDVFGPENVTVVTYGNVLAACAFLHGLGVQELQSQELDHHDANYQVIVAVRVVRSVETQAA